MDTRQWSPGGQGQSMIRSTGRILTAPVVDVPGDARGASVGRYGLRDGRFRGSARSSGVGARVVPSASSTITSQLKYSMICLRFRFS